MRPGIKAALLVAIAYLIGFSLVCLIIRIVSISPKFFATIFVICIDLAMVICVTIELLETIRDKLE